MHNTDIKTETHAKEQIDPFVEILQQVDDMINKSNMNKKESKVCQLMMEKFASRTFEEAFSSFQGIQKEAALMILQQALPDLSNDLRKISKLKLENFVDKNKISSYLDAIIKSGLAADIQHGIVFLVGNTGVGKSSLANTLKAYIDNPSDKPRSILAGTEENKHLLETQVLEVYNEVPFEQNQHQSVKLTKESESGLTLVDFVDEANSVTTSGVKKNINIRLVDMGGHQEYYACSSLFFSTSGLFLICFDSWLLQKIEDKGNNYYGTVGTFVDLVSQTSSISGMKLKIALVATKTEASKLPQNLKESCKKLLEITKDHLGSLSPELFLVNEVITTSSQEVTPDILENLRTKIATLCSDRKLKGGFEEMRPFSWHKFLDAASQDLYLSVDKAKYLWEKEKDEVGEAKNISPEESRSLLTFQSIVEIMIEEDKSEQNDELKLESELEADANPEEEEKVDTIVEPLFEADLEEKNVEPEEKRSKPLSKEKKEQEVPENPSTKTPEIKENMEKGLTKKAEKQALQNKNDESTKEDTDKDLVLDLEEERKMKSETLNEEEEAAVKEWIEGRKEVTAILSYFADYGEVLWFQANENLYDFVINDVCEVTAHCDNT